MLLHQEIPPLAENARSGLPLHIKINTKVKGGGQEHIKINSKVKGGGQECPPYTLRPRQVTSKAALRCRIIKTLCSSTQS